jgi:uroporphyrinogen-III synthase
VKKLVILRPEPGASATLARAREAGLDAVATPLFEVRPIAWDVPDAGAFDALLLTSANAVRFGGPQLAMLRGLPAYCVGAATAAAAGDAGFNIAAVGQGNAASLAQAIPAGTRLLHLAGRDHRRIEGATTIAVYDNAAIDPAPALDTLAGGVAMIHSPRAGDRLAALVSERGDISIAAISSAAAVACGLGWAEVGIAVRPDDATLLAVAAELCQTSGQ